MWVHAHGVLARLWAMSAAGYIAVLASSLAPPIGYTAIKVAHLSSRTPKTTEWLLHTGRFIVIVVYPLLVVVAYLYGERYLVPVSHAAGVIWHTALSWVFLPEGRDYGRRNVLGAAVYSGGVALIIYTNAESKHEDDSGDWDRLATWTVVWQLIGTVALHRAAAQRKGVCRWWFVVCGMLKSTEILISAAAWNLVENDYESGWALTALFAVPLLAAGLATVILTDKLVGLYEMCQIMPAQTAVFVLVGVGGDVFFYNRWSHWTPEEGAVFATGLSCVVAGIYLFR